MKNLKDIILEKLTINKNTKIDNYHYHPKDKEELKELIEKLTKEYGTEVNLNDIDTSKITDMSYMFYNSAFNGDISEWDVSNVENMASMFAYSDFDCSNGDISEWDVSNVTNMECIFFESYFNGDISKWDVSNVENMNNMFSFSKFTGKNGNISKCDVSNVKYMFGIFVNSKFDGDINDWDVKKTARSKNMFENSPLEKNPPQWFKK